jgi:CheY-like chemotaxis protein
VEIRVADSGEGIAPEVMPHIFERFRQGDATTSRRHGGLGLGLALVRQLAELHGGAVRAESEGLGNGATFTIELPLASVSETAHDVPRLTPKSQPANAVDLKGIRVLIVDDEPDALAMVRRVLEENEANVRTADSTQAALELLGKQPFDVIVSDIAMPGATATTSWRNFVRKGSRSLRSHSRLSPAPRTESGRSSPVTRCTSRNR